MDERKEYAKKITFNGSVLTQVVIDQHYQEKHHDISDDLILGMLELVDGKPVDPEDDADEDGFQYFKIESLEFQGRHYRLILVTCIGMDFLGVVNAFRVEKKK